MVRGVITRLVSAAGAVAVATALAIAAAPASALAAPRPPAKPTAVEIKGEGLPGNRIVVQQSNVRLFATLLGEVAWMATAKPQTGAPPAANLGPKYTVTVFTKTTPTQVYDLYPKAAGGPRAHRPAKQPSGRKTADGWFYGRLSMPETLRSSGVPLEAKPDVVAGGIGGGEGQDFNAGEIDPIAGAKDLLGQMRQLFLLNGAVLVVILVVLAGIAYLIRRRV